MGRIMCQNDTWMVMQGYPWIMVKQLHWTIMLSVLSEINGVAKRGSPWSLASQGFQGFISKIRQANWKQTKEQCVINI